MLPCWWAGWFHRLPGCCCPGAGVRMLMDEAGSQDLWLQGPGGFLGLVPTRWCVGLSPGPWWAGPCPGAAVGSGGLKLACLLVGGAVSPPS